MQHNNMQANLLTLSNEVGRLRALHRELGDAYKRASDRKSAFGRWYRCHTELLSAEKALLNATLEAAGVPRELCVKEPLRDLEFTAPWPL